MIFNRKEVEAAEQLLLLEPGYTADNVSAEFKRLAKEHHPDMPTGNAAMFVALDRAKHLLHKHLESGPPAGKPFYKRPDCPNCAGKGRLMFRRGFAQIPITCGRCKGSGDAAWESDNMDN